MTGVIAASGISLKKSKTQKKSVIKVESKSGMTGVIGANGNPTTKSKPVVPEIKVISVNGEVKSKNNSLYRSPLSKPIV